MPAEQSLESYDLAFMKGIRRCKVGHLHRSQRSHRRSDDRERAMPGTSGLVRRGEREEMFALTPKPGGREQNACFLNSKEITSARFSPSTDSP